VPKKQVGFPVARPGAENQRRKRVNKIYVVQEKESGKYYCGVKNGKPAFSKAVKHAESVTVKRPAEKTAKSLSKETGKIYIVAEI